MAASYLKTCSALGCDFITTSKQEFQAHLSSTGHRTYAPNQVVVVTQAPPISIRNKNRVALLATAKPQANGVMVATAGRGQVIKRPPMILTGSSHSTITAAGATQVAAMQSHEVKIVTTTEEKKTTKSKKAKGKKEDEFDWVNCIVALDTSGSMSIEGKAAAGKEGCNSLIGVLRKKDSVHILGFNETVTTIAQRGKDSTVPEGSLETKVNHAAIHGMTALYDAIIAIERLLESNNGGKKEIIVLTDGDDTASTGAGVAHCMAFLTKYTNRKDFYFTLVQIGNQPCVLRDQVFDHITYHTMDDGTSITNL